MHLIGTAFILLFARLILGAVMLRYGWPKIRNLRSNAADFVRKGFRPGWLWGTLVAVAEFVGGLAVIAGVWTELFAAAFGFEMLLGTFWKYKVRKPFSDYSYDLLALAIALVLMRFGAGTLFVRAPAPFALGYWELAGGATIVAIIAAAASRPRMKR